MSEAETGEDGRCLGVLGTLVWDIIHGPGPGGPVEEWGGLAYALSAFESTGPSSWRALPLAKVGKDLSEEARSLLASYDRLASLDGVRSVEEPNNRVELRYSDGARREERLTGGVPGWSWAELEPLVGRCDAMYVNFIAGWELDLETARTLRRRFDGLVYADLHSLLLEVGPNGVRRPRPLDDGREWVRCFDFVQMNEDELETLAAGDRADPWEFAGSLVGSETRAVFVTRGCRGAAWRAAGGRSGERAAEVEVADADPTGCGDVWGITCFTSLLEGADVPEAVDRANRMAARNADARGGTGLLGES